jgi:hypothetical protein
MKALQHKYKEVEEENMNIKIIKHDNDNYYSEMIRQLK